MLLISVAVISLLAGVCICLSCDAFLSLAWLWVLPTSFLCFFLGLLLLGLDS